MANIEEKRSETSDEEGDQSLNESWEMIPKVDSSDEWEMVTVEAEQNSLEEQSEVVPEEIQHESSEDDSFEFVEVFPNAQSAVIPEEITHESSEDDSFEFVENFQNRSEVVPEENLDGYFVVERESSNDADDEDEEMFQDNSGDHTETAHVSSENEWEDIEEEQTDIILEGRVTIFLETEGGELPEEEQTEVESDERVHESPEDEREDILVEERREHTLEEVLNETSHADSENIHEEEQPEELFEGIPDSNWGRISGDVILELISNHLPQILISREYHNKNVRWHAKEIKFFMCSYLKTLTDETKRKYICNKIKRCPEKLSKRDIISNLCHCTRSAERTGTSDLLKCDHFLCNRWPECCIVCFAKMAPFTWFSKKTNSVFFLAMILAIIFTHEFCFLMVELIALVKAAVAKFRSLIRSLGQEYAPDRSELVGWMILLISFVSAILMVYLFKSLLAAPWSIKEAILHVITTGLMVCIAGKVAQHIESQKQQYHSISRDFNL